MAAFYRATLADFLAHPPVEILGSLLRSYQHNELQKQQTKAWEIEIQVIKSACGELVRHTPATAQWSLLLEYPMVARTCTRPATCRVGSKFRRAAPSCRRPRIIVRL